MTTERKPRVLRRIPFLIASRRVGRALRPFMCRCPGIVAAALFPVAIVSSAAAKCIGGRLIGLTLLLTCLVPNVYSQCQDFAAPEVEFIDSDGGSTFGSQLFHDLIPDPATLIRNACLDVCRVLYHRCEDVPAVTTITYYLEDYDGISVTWGPRPHVRVKYSTRWIRTTWQNSGGNRDAVLYETKGVLYHELTHAYQHNGNQIPSHAVEGIADAVRIAVKHIPYANRRPGGSYTDSYQRTGFFLDWLNQERFPGYDFLRRLNQTANPKTNKPWSWDVVRGMTGVDVDSLWAEYQNFLLSPLAASFTFVGPDTERLVQFEDKSISLTPVTRWRWDFGDGTTSTQANPQHTYKADGDYAVTLTITTSKGSSQETHLVSVPPSIPYCQSQSEDCTKGWIAEVTIGSTAHPSAASTYSDYTSFVIPLHSQETLPIALRAGFSGRTYPGASYKIWIDYDKDRIFNDREELVFDSGYTDQALVTGHIAVPYVAAEMQTRMRVSMKGGDTEVLDATDLGGTVTAEYYDSPQGEDKGKAFDNSDYTKYLTFHNHVWIQFCFDEGRQCPVSGYSVTSANDYSQRDPRDWQLLGSNDGASWVTIDTRRNESFSKRFETKNYLCNDQTPYRYYRLDVTRNNGGNETQFAEIRLFGLVSVPQLVCGSFESGEVEDYTVHIGGSASPASGTSRESFEQGFQTFPWKHSGNASWETTSGAVYAGTYSAKAGRIDDEQSSVLSVVVACLAGEVSFWVKVSSESGCDRLLLRIDGVSAGEWSGEQDWIPVSVPVAAGSHRFEWSYTKDGSVSQGDDTAWIDDLVFPAR